MIYSITEEHRIFFFSPWLAFLFFLFFFSNNDPPIAFSQDLFRSSLSIANRLPLQFLQRHSPLSL